MQDIRPEFFSACFFIAKISGVATQDSAGGSFGSVISLSRPWE
jgi:hypothetical protein